MNSQFTEFTQAQARALPVIILADVSGSMGAYGKIDALNQAVRDMLAAFASGDDLRADIQVAVVTFGGGGARVHVPLQPASAVEWTDMKASGGTPMGAAMALAADIIEDRGQIDSRAYRPTVVLVSDGAPTDNPQAGLNRLTKEGRAQKADRMAMAIGADADLDMMRAFLPAGRELFVAADARRIADFFEFVTMSTTTRSRAVNPNDIPQMQSPFDIDAL
jgi:uncharacterized protein YegL